MHMNGSIIGVVGPNGSGKSNVSDAVRWVLGEQSAKSLRGSMMQDVIFAGTQTRKPRSYCEVTLIFDNTDGRLGSEYTEIEVTRKLYRSGESEYFINQAKCRLKDILNLFRDTGIGREGYSIIGQGRIDEILSDKSLDRRRVFEEASGIMKYRVRKEEAERKLEKTRINLQRIGDILTEQAFLLEPLKKQAEDAAVYLDLSKRLRVLDINLFLQSCDKLRDRSVKLEQQKIELEEERKTKEELLETLISRLAKQQEQARRSEEDGSELAETISHSMADIERVEGEIKLCDERILNNEKNTLRIKNEIDEANAKTAVLNQNELTNKQRLEQIENELAAHRLVISEAGAEMDSLSSDYEDRVKVIETVQSEKMETIERMADVRSTVSALEEKRSSISQRIDDIDARIKTAKAEQAGAKDALDALDNDRQTIENKTTLARNAFNEAVQREREESGDIARAQQALETARREHAACVSSAKMLADMKAGFEGYSESVKNLMMSARDNADIGGRIRGTVADAMRVPADFEAAVEACLGGALQNIIVEDEYDAKQIIAHLRKNNMGRVTFLPLKSLRPRSLSNEEEKALSEAGVRGVASDLVKYDPALRNAIEFLLGRTVIVDNADTAISVMRRCSQSLRTVTLEGDVFNPGGSITGGSLRRERSGLVSRDRREEELRQSTEQLNSEVIALKDALDTKNNAHQSLLNEIEKMRGVLHDGEVEAAALREKRDSLNKQMSEAQARAELLKKEQDTQKEAIDRVAEEISGFATLQIDMQQSSETRDENYKRLEDEHNQRSVRIEQLKSQVHDAELRIAVLFRENAAVLSDNMRLGMEKQELERARATRQKTLELESESVENLLALKKELQESHRSRAEVLEGHKRRQSEMSAGRSAVMESLTALESEIDQTRRAITELSEKSMRAMFNIEKGQTDLEAAQNRLWDSHQLTYANALTEREEIDLSGAQAEADDIRAQLRELGVVNPAAIDDYAVLKERMTSLSTQRDDLSRAEQDLHKLIASLLTEMRRTFRQSFEMINKYFSATFKELFDGGRAELILEEGDIMECGIEIIAEPPGKKMQKLSLLSGGEKALTAISLLFALLKINPSPVCILDEIDAALDDANVQKFSEYLEKYASNMQFIVITHRKPTMSVCDSLFGFAMEEKGVSKLLSVRLDRENT